MRAWECVNFRDAELRILGWGKPQSREGVWRGGGVGVGGEVAIGMSKEGWWGGRGAGMGRVSAVDQ